MGVGVGGRSVPQACVGDMISVIDMPPPEESIWWRGKRGFQVGFFPCECVQVIGDKVPQTIQSQALTLPPSRTQASGAGAAASATHHTLNPSTQAPTKPVLRKHGKLIAFFRSFILSRPSRRKLKQSGILRERVFGCDLGEHLLNSGHEIPMVLRCCSEFLEGHGVVDGIYRLSGITSNIQKLRNAFDEDRIPDLYGDDSILQDIHCVSSVLKMYFRELPNPLLTYQLYEKFVAAVMQDEDIRLLYLRDVVQQLPPPHYRTLEYLVQHLARIASHSGDTGMTAKNIAIVWAPNLLRSKDLDMGGVAALQDVGTQAVVTEYLVRYVDLIFNDKIPTFAHSTNGVEGTPKKCRPKSLAISTPTKLISIEEARTRALNTAIKPDQKYIEVGGGPQNLPIKYHTVIELPSRKGGSLKQKKSPSGWKSLFGKGRSMHKHPRKASTPSDIHLNISDSVVTEADVAPSSSKRLRPVKSVESLISTSASLHSNRNSQAIDSPEKREIINLDKYAASPEEEHESRSSSLSSPLSSPRTHNRSVSHDSYFNMLEGRSNSMPSQVPVKEEGESDLDFSPENSRIYLDISELDLNFSTSEKDLKGFEVDTLKSTSVEEPDNMSSSTLDMENLSMCSEGARSKENLSPRPEKKSLKEKFKHRFSSPPTQRRNESGDSSEDSHNNSLKRTSVTIKDKIAHAISPETSRRRTESSPRPTSPGSSPKIKHVRTGEAERKDSQTSKPDMSGLMVGTRIVQESGGSIETVTAEVHVEAGNRENDETPTRFSMDGALIDPELLDKITHMRSSPSVSASEVSSTSLAEATVSDNESFTLGSSNSGVGAAEGKDIFSDTPSTAPPSSNAATPVAPSFTIVPEKFVIQSSASITPVTPVPEDITPLQECPKPRPNSLLGLPTADLLTLGSALTSPETPQGDSTFLEIQYHPLSDTTEPSTPSESQFVQDLVSIGQPVPCPATVEEPRQSSPLSIDLSSSDDPTEEGPMYENIDTSSLGNSMKSIDHQYQKLAPLSPSSSTQSSQASFHPDPTSRQALLEESGVASCDQYDNTNYGSVYENVQYGAEYENVEYGSGYQKLEHEASNDCITELERGESSRVIDNEKHRNICIEGDMCYGNMNATEEELDTVRGGAYENVESLQNESQPVYENMEDSSHEADHNVPDGDDAYEDYSFTDQPQYENMEFSSQALACSENDCDNKTPTEIDGEVVYQQVKFFRKSIQEVNEILHEGSENQALLQESDGSESGNAVMADCMTELPVQVPQMSNMIVSQTLESLSSSQDPLIEPGEVTINAELHTQQSEESECLDSPVTPSSVSVTTEVLVLPAFASPTESTTDDVTSPVSSDEASSPKPKYDMQEQPSSSLLGQILPSLSPPTPEHVVVVPPAATSTPSRNLPLSSVMSPAPWPRTGGRHTPVSAPVPRPRQLPKLNLTSPLVSPVSTPSSVSISPDSPATPGSLSSGSPQTTPVDEAEQAYPLYQAEDHAPGKTLETRHSLEHKGYENAGEPSTVGCGDSGIPGLENSANKTHDNCVKLESKPVPSQHPTFQRYKSSPDFRVTSKETKCSIDIHNTDDIPAAEVTNILSSINLTDPQKRERIEQYKKERRSYLREKYKSESFRGEKDEMILRLRQKATSPSRPDGDCDDDDDDDDDDEEEEDEEEVILSSNSSNTSPRRSISPVKQKQEMGPGKCNPGCHSESIMSREKISQENSGKVEKEEQESSTFKRSSPSRRSLSDMGRAGDIKSPTRTRFSSVGPGSSFRRSSSSSSTTSSSSGNRSEQGGSVSSLRRSPDKEVLLQRSSSSESKSSPSRKTSSSSSPVMSPEGVSFYRSGSTRSSGRAASYKENIDEDINVRERVAIWSKTKDKPPSRDPSGSDSKLKKQDQKSGREMVKKNFSPPLSPIKKSSLTRSTSASPCITKSVSSHGHSPTSSAIPKPTHSSSTRGSLKSSSKSQEEHSDGIGAAAVGNSSVRGNAGQQRRIRDMAAMFERDSPTGTKPAVVRQSSREEKKERY
ncbi:hypothetical protein Pmani_021170 [Petrolisthes manimaculis]|uniref:Rho GTPase-activating protein 32 n=1 Tax=Petrolisthes manimaculis TaxID=1843537 RepID=A0AAE1U5J9_9EUCA|nr:hypothetical protein Pmani_021170 [Petrolisthes manimaculis]